MQLSSFKGGFEFLGFDVSVQALRTLLAHEWFSCHSLAQHTATELEEWSPLLSGFSKNVDAVIAPLFKPLVVSANGILSNCSQNELTRRHRAHN